MTRVAIVGVGHTVFGRRGDASAQELAFEAFRDALDDAGLDPDAIEASVIASVPEYQKQRSIAGVVQEYLGLGAQPPGSPRPHAPPAAPPSARHG